METWKLFGQFARKTQTNIYYSIKSLPGYCHEHLGLIRQYNLIHVNINNDKNSSEIRTETKALGTVEYFFSLRI